MKLKYALLIPTLAATIAAVAFLDDPATRFAVTAERAALAALGGGCQVPIGIHCRPELCSAEGNWEILAVVADPETGSAIRAFHTAPHTDADPVTLGRQVVEKLISAGAGPLLQRHAQGGVAR